VYDSTNESISLRWDAPKYDGGHRIAGYDIERLNLPSKNWVKCNMGNISAQEFTVRIVVMLRVDLNLQCYYWFVSGIMINRLS